MRITAFFCAVFLAAYALLSFLPIRGEEEIYGSMIRLHVIAQSDSEAHQAEKLAVRDAVLACLAGTLADAGDYSSALQAVSAALPDAVKAAEETAGCPVTASLGTERSPTGQYEDFTLPAGEYTSLRVILGEGEGRNWWCVLFPKLCTARAAGDGFYEDFIAAGFSPEQYRLIRNDSGTKYRIRFRILELLTQWQNGADKK